MAPETAFATCFCKSFVGPSRTELKTLYDINETDWVLLANALSSIPVITREAILKEIRYEQLRHDVGKLRQFWDGVFNVFSR